MNVRYGLVSADGDRQKSANSGRCGGPLRETSNWDLNLRAHLLLGKNTFIFMNFLLHKFSQGP
jgi:hypothetical protein